MIHTVIKIMRIDLKIIIREKYNKRERKSCLFFFINKATNKHLHSKI